MLDLMASNPTSGACAASACIVRIWPSRLAPSPQNHVPAGLQLQAVQGRLKRELAPIHRRGQRQNAEFQLIPDPVWEVLPLPASSAQSCRDEPGAGFWKRQSPSRLSPIVGCEVHNAGKFRSSRWIA